MQSSTHRTRCCTCECDAAPYCSLAAALVLATAHTIWQQHMDLELATGLGVHTAPKQQASGCLLGTHSACRYSFCVGELEKFHTVFCSAFCHMPVAAFTPLGSPCILFCVCVHSVEFGAILLWFFVCDRTTVFWQAEKVRRVHGVLNAKSFITSRGLFLPNYCLHTSWHLHTRFLLAAAI